MDERRKYIRVSSEIRVVCKASGETLGHNAYTADISAGGVCLWLAKMIKPGTMLDMDFYLPALKDPFVCKGRVVRQSMRPHKGPDDKFYYETGMVFDGLSLKNRMALIYYVHEKMKK
jgi:c-di-GMP-binding flagellar brake protein YcgR